MPTCIEPPNRQCTSDGKRRDRPFQARLEDRHPHWACQVHTHNKSLDGRLAAHALALATTGKLSVGYDIRHLPPENIGTRTYAVNLAKALADLPEVELTLLVDTQCRLTGSRADRHRGAWRDDVAVIHKPAQVFNPQELGLLFGSSAHVVITYQDLIAYRCPVVFSSDPEYEAYRATSGLSVQAAQRILAYSESSGGGRSHRSSAFRSTRSIVVPLGVEAELFANREPGDATIARELKSAASLLFQPGDRLSSQEPRRACSTPTPCSAAGGPAPTRRACARGLFAWDRVHGSTTAWTRRPV